jgi:Cache domain
MVPATLIALLLIGYDYYDRERDRLARDSMTTARALIAAVDAELVGVRSALLALATSPHLSSANFAAFHGQALAAQQDQAFVNVILSDRNGRQLINTFRPFGEPLPSQGDPGGLLRVFDTGMPLISGLFQGRLTRSYIVGVGVPVRRDSEVRYALSAGLAPDRLSQLLAQQNLPQGWIAGILDGSGIIVARTVEAERLIGQKGSPELVRRMQEAREDTFESRTLEGIPVLTVFSRSPVSGWTVAIGIPQRELTAHLWSSMARLFIAAFIALITALGLAVLLGRRLLR